MIDDREKTEMENSLHSTTVFTFAYQLTRPSNPAAAGFTVNLLSNDQLLYACYDVDRQKVQECRFQLQQGTHSLCLKLIEHNNWWLQSVPERMRTAQQGQAGSTLIIGFADHPLFCLEGFDTLLQCRFGSQRGHYTRQLYSLLEDIAAVLRSQALYLSPDAFEWDTHIIRPVEQNQYPSRYT